MPKAKGYYFIKRSGLQSLNGAAISNWAFSNNFSSKAKLKKYFTHGSQTVRIKEIYSAKQLIATKRKSEVKIILNQILALQPDLRKNKIE